jgi:peptidoglycan biosynthesis protein MviN/MurJ (putative lipid II flippase)
VLHPWLLFAHIASALLLLASHGVSMVVLYRIRRERDRAKILTLVTLSGETILPMYIAIGLILLSGVALGLESERFGQWWVWIAILLFVATIGLMAAIAKPYFVKVKAACEVRPSGVPRVSDEELGEILGSGTAHLITAIGVGGLLAIVYLMIFKPWVL